jgi:hypothetical protein
MAHYVQDDQATELCPAYDIYKDKTTREVDLCPSSGEGGEAPTQFCPAGTENCS